VLPACRPGNESHSLSFSRRGQAKTHVPTDVAALGWLEQNTLSPLPALVLEFRAMQVHQFENCWRKACDMSMQHAERLQHCSWLPPHVQASLSSRMAEGPRPRDSATPSRLSPKLKVPPSLDFCPPLQNVLTKYVQPSWAVAAAREAAVGGGAATRVRCRWQQTAVATGRLSCVVPNLQVRL